MKEHELSLDPAKPRIILTDGQKCHTSHILRMQGINLRKIVKYLGIEFDYAIRGVHYNKWVVTKATTDSMEILPDIYGSRGWGGVSACSIAPFGIPVWTLPETVSATKSYGSWTTTAQDGKRCFPRFKDCTRGHTLMWEVTSFRKMENLIRITLVWWSGGTSHSPLSAFPYQRKIWGDSKWERD